MSDGHQVTADDERWERMYADALAAFRRGDNQECRRISERALTEASDAGSRRGQALGHLNLSRADFRDGRHASGLENAARAGSLAAACGADDLRVTALHMRAELTRASGDYAAALPLYEELLAADEARADEALLAMEHYNLGSVLIQTGDLEGARSHLQLSLSLLPAKPEQVRYTMLGYAGWLCRSGDPSTAGRVLGAVEAHFKVIGEVLDPAEAAELASHVAAGRQRDAAAFDTGRLAGRSLTLDEVRALLE